ncbi:MAG: TMEM165/GDT1 family protein [Elusimicrobia bacterium]|nr:TMEM165/GDT1 family protein [Candidatus Obscuribacterium magneticum]
MDWKIFLTAFSTLFLAEIGDKTQLAVFTLTASTQKPLAVFLGSALALSVVTGLGVLVGEGVGRVVPAHIMNKLAAALFIGIGIWMLLKR